MPLNSVVMLMDTKICAKCGEAWPLSEFHKSLRSKDGLHSHCKICNKKKAAAYLKTDKGKAADSGYYRYGKGAIPILKQGAKRREISFNVNAETLDQWWRSQLGSCYYCGIKSTIK